jgi:MFS family permease
LLNRTFRALVEYKDFRLIWCGACVSSVGTWMQKLAQSWLVLELSDSPFLLGLDAFLGEIPIFLFSLIGGVIADRMDRRVLLVGGQIIQMSCAFILAGLYFFDVLHWGHILCLSFMVGLAQAFGGPAYAALIPTLVKSRDVPNAIAMNSIQFNIARVLGPMIGGLALTKLGAGWCFTINGLSFLAVITSLVLIKVNFKPSPTTDSMMESMKDGIRFIRAQAGMEPLIALAFCMTVLGIPVVVFLPVFARDVFQQGPELFTLFLSLSGAGSIVGALLVATFGHREHKGRVTLFSLIALGLSIAGFAMSTNLWLSCALLFVSGIALMLVFAMVTSLVQLSATDEMRGRVMSVYNVAFRGGMPIGSLVTGKLVPMYTAPVVFLSAGLLLSLIGFYFLFGQKKIAKL